MRVHDDCAQWRPRSLLLPLLLLVFCLSLFSHSSVLGYVNAPSSSLVGAPNSTDVDGADATAASSHVTAVIVGATGNLAAKYLWVALFRLALRASLTRGESFAFVAGASDPPERGAQWLRAFFNDTFERRVCGANGDDDAAADEQTRACSGFYRDVFIPSVRYMPLRSEAHYRDVAKLLNDRATATTEAGRLVYLAIPPDYFLQTSELMNRFLRIPSNESSIESAPFLRVVIEKPFGTSAESAQALAAGLKWILRDDEIYLMDHYAGKPGVRAWRSYLERNRELLRPLWSSRSIRHVQIEMTETETLEGRVQYFHSTGIVRDVMVNHLHLLLGFTIAPSASPNALSQLKKLEVLDRDLRLAFTKSLRWSDDTLRSWQYAEYRAHYERDTKREELAVAFDEIHTPTAARVTFTSDLSFWNTTLFTLAAAKAAAERQVTVRIIFASTDSDSELPPPCTLTVVIQRELNAHGSQRIEWSCNLIPPQTHHPPSGWKFTDTSKQTMAPLDAGDAAHRSEQQHHVWQLGDEVTAYDSLLWDTAIGDKSHFANIDEVLAAWQLWTPIAESAEVKWPAIATNNAAQSAEQRTYRSGTTPWVDDLHVDRPSDSGTLKTSQSGHAVDEL